jgi:hypothetical protein
MDWLCKTGYEKDECSDVMGTDRGEWKERHTEPIPNELGHGQKEEEE